MNPPLFSIVIPLYNKEPYIAKTLDSVLAQELGDYEVLVVNDGSKDGGAATVRQYAEKDARIRLIEQENAGVSVARNTGIAHAQGQYVAFLDADDWWEPNHLTELKTLAQTYPAAGMLGTAYRKVFAKPPHVDILHRKLKGQRLVVDYFELNLKTHYLFTSCIAIKRSVLAEQETLFPPGVRNGEDLDLWARVAISTQLAYSANVTVNYNCAVEGSATKTVYQNKPSLYPCITLGKLVKGHPTNASLQAYADHALFIRALKVHLYYRESSRDYLLATQADLWSTSKKLKLMKKFPQKMIWRIFHFYHKAIYSRKILYALKISNSS